MPAPTVRTIRLDVAWGGMDVDSAPNAVERPKGVLVQNYLTGDKGRLRQRGPIVGAALAYGITDKRLAGALAGSDKLLIGFKDAATATRTVEPWVAPYKPSVDTALAKAHTGANTFQIANLATPGLTGLAPTSRSYIPGPRQTRYGKWVYGIAYDSDDDTAGTIVDNGYGGKERLTRMLRWDSTGLTNPVVYTYAPFGAQDLRIHYSRLMVVGGRHPTTTGLKIEHNSLWYTDILNATDFDTGINSADANAAIWAGDPPAGADPAADNRFELPGDMSDFGVAIAPAGRHLAIFKRRSILVLAGFGPGSWQLRTFAEGVGCLDPRSVVEANDGCFFMSAQGFMFFDGVQLADVSQGIHDTLLTAALNAVGDAGVDGGFCIGERLTNDFVMLTIGSAPFGATPAAPTVTFCGLFHIPSRSWGTFHSTLFTGNAPMFVGATERRLALADHSNLYPTANLTTPQVALATTRGKDLTSVIQTKWHSRLAELSGPFAVAKLHRVMIDYEWIIDADGAGGAVGPTVTVLDGTGTTLASYTLPSGIDTTQPPYRQRHVQDVFAESGDVQVRVEYTGSAVFLDRCTILDVWVEYEQGQERH